MRMSFQAPPGPGLYTFQVYCMSDSFVGVDAQRDMRVRAGDLLPESCLETDPPSTLWQMKVEPPQEGEEVEEEDDISDPEEDTLAGQMALMKGQSVKRSAVHGDGDDDDEEEYTSGTDETDTSSDDSSDSDSD